MKITQYQIDAFTNKTFGGNPAAVCPLDQWIPDETMQMIAEENNLSETAFFVPENDGYRIRWFTPISEIDLAGHPTLATAYVIFHFIDPKAQNIIFYSNSGKLYITRESSRIVMDFPPFKLQDVEPEKALMEGLAVEPLEVKRSRDYLVVLKSEEEVTRCTPNMHLLSMLDTLGVIITAPGDNCDFVSRFFAPGEGINEDPVTGSAHATLVPYWSEKLGKQKLHAFQISKRRGELWCEMRDGRVIIAGEAAYFMKGELEF